MLRMLNFVSLKDGVCDVFYENGVKLGQLLMEVDGFYVFYPDLNGGFWQEHVLKQLADKLKSLNEKWNAEINEYFNRENNSKNSLMSPSDCVI